MNRRQIAAVIGSLLVLGYAVPLFLPPLPAPPAPTPPGADVWQRLFPGLPSWWHVSRLACVAIGAALIAATLGGRMPLALGPAAARRGAGGGVNHWIALLLAAAHAGVGLFAAQLSRAGEIGYFLFLAAPAAVLLFGERAALIRAVRRHAPRLLLLLVVPTLWLGVSLPSAWRSPRAANVVDMWIMWVRLQEVALGKHRILTDSASPGHSNAYAMLEGVPFLGPDGYPVTFTWLQVSHCFWTMVCLIALGAIAWMLIGRAAAIVAQASFAFSQYVMSAPYEPGFMVLAPLCCALALLLLLVVWRSRSAAALAALGAIAGFSGTEPTVAVIALLLLLLAVPAWRPAATGDWLPLAIASLSCAAAMIPALPDLDTILAMAQQYTFGRVHTDLTTLVLLGQASPHTAFEAVKAANPAVYDIPLGAALAPLAVRRLPIRLIGDSLLDPLGSVLMAIGLMLAVRHIIHNRAALLLLVLLALGLGHGMTSGSDVVSYNRLAAALVPLAILAGLGFEVVRSAWLARSQPTLAAALVAAMMAGGGTLLFERVNPTILPASWLAISLEAVAGEPPAARISFVDYSKVPWLYVDEITALLPPRPLETLKYEEFQALDAGTDAAPRLLFWCPGLEDEAALAHAICERWPGARLYVLSDAAGLFHAFAAATRGLEWQPALPRARWTVTPCASRLPDRRAR